ncbi:hypothetical protein HY989_01400 [Candidatus Micrarchaeota archaeon]|nr:hypothetical protein [Candidatus Micrarchaeota archaeon]
MKKYPNFIGPITSRKKFKEMVNKGNLNYIGFFGRNNFKVYFSKSSV